MFFPKHLLVDPWLAVTVPGASTLREPKSNFLLSILGRIRAMANVATYFNAVVTSNGTRGGVRWLSGTKHFASSCDSTKTFPNHAAHWSTIKKSLKTTNTVAVIRNEIKLKAANVDKEKNKVTLTCSRSNQQRNPYC